MNFCYTNIFCWVIFVTFENDNFVIALLSNVQVRRQTYSNSQSLFALEFKLIGKNLSLLDLSTDIIRYFGYEFE